MKNRTVVGLLAAFLLGATVGCSSPLGDAPPDVRAALDPFIRSGYACTAGRSDNSVFRQWQCDGATDQGAQYTVIVDADARHLKNVVATIDQSHTGTTNRDAAIRFFGEIADLGIGGRDPSIKSWIATHLGDGAQEWTGSVFITVDELKPVTHLVVFDPA